MIEPLESDGGPRVVAIIADNAGNIQNAALQVKGVGKLGALNCMGHATELVVKDIAKMIFPATFGRCIDLQELFRFVFWP